MLGIFFDMEADLWRVGFLNDNEEIVMISAGYETLVDAEEVANNVREVIQTAFIRARSATDN